MDLRDASASKKKGDATGIDEIKATIYILSEIDPGKKVTRLALMNSKLTQSLSMHNLAASFHSDTSGIDLKMVTMITMMMLMMPMLVMVIKLTSSRVNSASVALLLPLKFPALSQPRLHPGLDVLQLVHHVHPRPAQLLRPPGPLIQPQPSSTQLKPLSRDLEEICDTKKRRKHIPKTP